MSTLPSIFSNNSLRKPQRQGGLFSLTPTNQARFSRSQDLLSSDDMKYKPRLSLSSLPKRELRRTSRYSKQIFQKTSRFVSPDHFQQGSPEEADNVNAIKTRVSVSTHLMAAYLKSESQNLLSIKKDLNSIKALIQGQLAAIEVEMSLKMKQLRNNLSSMRRETGTETKINREQQVELTESAVILKSIYEEQIERTCRLCFQCQIPTQQQELC